MAKIVTGEEQKAALKTVLAEFKILEKLRMLLTAAGTDCKITFSITGINEDCRKASYRVPAREAHALILDIYKQKVRNVQKLTEEHHIVLENSEADLLKFETDVGLKQE